MNNIFSNASLHTPMEIEPNTILNELVLSLAPSYPQFKFIFSTSMLTVYVSYWEEEVGTIELTSRAGGWRNAVEMKPRNTSSRGKVITKTTKLARAIKFFAEYFTIMTYEEFAEVDMLGPLVRFCGRLIYDAHSEVRSHGFNRWLSPAYDMLINHNDVTYDITERRKRLKDFLLTFGFEGSKIDSYFSAVDLREEFSNLRECAANRDGYNIAKYHSGYIVKFKGEPAVFVEGIPDAVKFNVGVLKMLTIRGNSYMTEYVPNVGLRYDQHKYYIPERFVNGKA